MKTRLFVLIMVLLLILASCGKDGGETSSPETETPTDSDAEISVGDMTEAEETLAPEPQEHKHEYKVTKTVEGDCVDDGYDLYSCVCGLSYKSIIPSAHSYTTVKDSTGKYVKNLCTMCGDYDIKKIENCEWEINFEGYTDLKEATNSQKDLEFYIANPIDNGYAVIENGIDGNRLRISNSNYYIQDVSKKLATEKFVVSMDVMFKEYTDMYLISIIHFYGGNEWRYNPGIVVVNADGTVSAYGGIGKSVRLKEKGYNNITVVCDGPSGICDVYVNGELIGENIQYIKHEPGMKEIYIRFFDRKSGFEAVGDNMKLYLGTIPEFVVPDGLKFAN